LSLIVVLRLVKEAQLQHGLRHDDYQRYRYGIYDYHYFACFWIMLSIFLFT